MKAQVLMIKETGTNVVDVVRFASHATAETVQKAAA